MLKKSVIIGLLLLVAIGALVACLVIFVGFSSGDKSNDGVEKPEKPSDLYSVKEATANYQERGLKTLNYCGATTKNLFVLTFDDGPDELATPTLLAELRASNVKATFFVTPNIDQEATPSSGKCALVRTILSEGHSVQSHTWSNANLESYSNDEIALDLYATRKWIEKCAGDQISKLDLFAMRPPLGQLKLDGSQARYITKVDDYVVTGWNVDSGDAVANQVSVDQILSTIRDNVAKFAPDNGSVIVPLHDRIYRNQGSQGLIGALVNEYEARGYKFASLRECYTECGRDICEDQNAWPRYFAP